MDLDVLFVGTAGSAPTPRRGLPAMLIRRGGERLLFDCGEGTQRQLARSAGLVDLDDVFITHFHADHILGLPGMLKTFELRSREQPLTIHGPPGLRRVLDIFAPIIGKTSYALQLNELEAGEEVERDGYNVAAFAVNHRGVAYGYLLAEGDRPGRFDEARARELGVEPGPDFGRLQRGESVAGSGGDVAPEQVVGEARRGRRVVVSGDTTPCDMTLAVAHRADLLVHEATFMAADSERAIETKHSTARGAARLAAEAEVALLALTHLSARYPAGDIRDEAREEFRPSVVPRDFDRVSLPFPERGEPEHIRGD
jgi:ribonuclease Z